jgi:hypothetical protein
MVGRKGQGAVEHQTKQDKRGRGGDGDSIESYRRIGRMGVANQLGHERQIGIDSKQLPEVLAGDAIPDAKDPDRQQQEQQGKTDSPRQAPADETDHRKGRQQDRHVDRRQEIPTRRLGRRKAEVDEKIQQRPRQQEGETGTQGSPHPVDPGIGQAERAPEGQAAGQGRDGRARRREKPVADQGQEQTHGNQDEGSASNERALLLFTRRRQQHQAQHIGVVKNAGNQHPRSNTLTFPDRQAQGQHQSGVRLHVEGSSKIGGPTITTGEKAIHAVEHQHEAEGRNQHDQRRPRQGRCRRDDEKETKRGNPVRISERAAWSPTFCALGHHGKKGSQHGQHERPIGVKDSREPQRRQDDDGMQRRGPNLHHAPKPELAPSDWPEEKHRGRECR